MGKYLAALPLLLLFSACTHSYPYLVLSDHCECEVYTYRNTRHNFEIEFRASYKLNDRIITSVEIQFRNNSRDTMSLKQAYLTGTSRNVRYQYNGKPRPLPYETIAPRATLNISLEGSDMENVENPWLKIAGERVVLEITGLILGKTYLPPIRVELMPMNPKLSG